MQRVLTTLGLRQPGPAITQQDRDILDLKHLRDRVKQYLKKIQFVRDREDEDATQYIRAGRMDRALVAVHRRRVQDSLLAKTNSQLENLKQIVSKIELASVQAEVLKDLKKGNELLEEIHEGHNIENVEKLLHETHALEIDAALIDQMTADEEDALQQEFEQLVRLVQPYVRVPTLLEARRMLDLACRPPSAGPFDCPYADCGRTFTLKHRLRAHMLTHSTPRPFACAHERCGRTFTQQQHLQRHGNVHWQERPFASCARTFVKRNDVTRHARMHSRPVKVSVTSEDAGDVQRHATVLPEDRPFACPHEGCGKAFALEDRLRAHTFMHSAPRPFACTHERCGRTFTQQQHLTKHGIVHWQERPFVCGQDGCSRTFAKNHPLKRHAVAHSNARIRRTTMAMAPQAKVPHAKLA